MRFSIMFLLVLTINISIDAQIVLKQEYIGRSTYKDKDDNKLGKGNSFVTSLGAMIPISVKKDIYDRNTFWGVASGASYTSFEIVKALQKKCFPKGS